MAIKPWRVFNVGNKYGNYTSFKCSKLMISDSKTGFSNFMAEMQPVHGQKFS